MTEAFIISIIFNIILTAIIFWGSGTQKCFIARNLNRITRDIQSHIDLRFNTIDGKINKSKKRKNKKMNNKKAPEGQGPSLTLGNKG